MENSADELRAILSAYQQVAAASWPDLNPEHVVARVALGVGVGGRASRGARRLSAGGRAAEAATCASCGRPVPSSSSAAATSCSRKDAGLKASELIGTDDFDKRLPWRHQAAKYRRDDETVVKTGQGEPRHHRAAGVVGRRHDVGAGGQGAAQAGGRHGVRSARDVRDRRRRHRPRPLHEVHEERDRQEPDQEPWECSRSPTGHRSGRRRPRQADAG